VALAVNLMRGDQAGKSALAHDPAKWKPVSQVARQCAKKEAGPRFSQTRLAL
jgi:hypothetical protein